jgi:hypothetical protein
MPAPLTLAVAALAAAAYQALSGKIGIVSIPKPSFVVEFI